MVFNMSEQEWDEVIAVHLKGHFATIKPASVIMRQQRYGRIINFSSESGLWGNAGQANYGAAKSAIAGLTRVVARDLGRYGVTCNAIAPRAWTRLVATIPGRDGNPDTTRPPAARPRDDRPDGRLPRHRRRLERQRPAPSSSTPAPSPSSSTRPPGAPPSSPACGTLDELTKAIPDLLEGTRNPAPPPDELEVPGRNIEVPL